VKKIRSDNRSEFKNLQVEEYLEEEGIKHEFSAPYTPQQNGGREEEQDAYRHGEDDAWRVQDA
jgi:transposase InsO family protein